MGLEENQERCCESNWVMSFFFFPLICCVVGAGMNVLAGVGVLTTPYAVKEGGWLGLLLLFVLSAICCYTGILLRHCLESAPGISTYPDIGQAAFGNTGRLIIAVSTHCMNV